jgi:hypothetical protein
LIAEYWLNIITSNNSNSILYQESNQYDIIDNMTYMCHLLVHLERVLWLVGNLSSAQTKPCAWLLGRRYQEFQAKPRRHGFFASNPIVSNCAKLYWASRFNIGTKRNFETTPLEATTYRLNSSQLCCPLFSHDLRLSLRLNEKWSNGSDGKSDENQRR